MDLRNQPADMGGDGTVVGVFEECPFERHRPRRSCRANIRQRLLHADRSVRSLHDEHEIEIAVADFPHSPIFGFGSEQRANVAEFRDQRKQAPGIERPVCGGGQLLRQDQLPFAVVWPTALRTASPPKVRPESGASCRP